MRFLQLLFLLLPLLCLEGCGPPEEYQTALARTRERTRTYASARHGALDPSSGCTYRIELRPGRVTKRKGTALSGRLVGSVPVPEGPGRLRLGGYILVDRSKGFVYVGTARGLNTPAQVIKIATGEGAEPPQLVGSILLEAGESNLSCGVIDRENGYAYFGARSCVVKIALGDGEKPPTRVGALVLDDDERARAKHVVIDVSRGYAYFSTRRAIVKVALGEGAEPPVRVGVVRATTRDVLRGILHLAVLLLLAAIPLVLSLPFSVPLSRAFIRSRDHVRDQLRSGEGGDPRAMMTRGLWRRLRWWILFWSVPGVLIFYLIYPAVGVKPLGPLVRLAHAATLILGFYGPLPYMLAASLLWTPRCVRWRSLFLWTHFGGWIGFALACAAVVFGLETVLHPLDFKLPSQGYNPGYPDPEATFTYTALLGIAIVCFCWFRFRRRIHLGSPKRDCST